ncbi:MAG TPA: DUF4190 domain-containing protein [Ornithinimicrobium sp.]|uniref:DUF4190 domain-containing protein n=1 Tax=Ornithinimicrobium sp. TaxID=1977084 RepID=UPI002B48C5C7|nr:DUF4190 domain-containing protein [Ornithinimicrobium sp.]HKJ10983.1 DUF4190 domain-containing protein [Ornithinimicrobium sp.]
MSTPPPPPGGNDENPYTSQPGPGSEPAGQGSPGYGSGAYGSSEPAPPASGYEAAPGYYGGQMPSDAENNLGVIALVTGIISLVACAPLGIVAVIYGRKAQAATAAGRANNGTLGTVGFWLGAVALALMVLGIIFVVVLLVFGLSVGGVNA